MVQLLIVAVCLGILVVGLLSLLAWAVWAAMKESAELAAVPELATEEDEALMLARYRAQMEESAREQKARWAGLRKGMGA